MNDVTKGIRERQIDRKNINEKDWRKGNEWKRFGWLIDWIN